MGSATPAGSSQLKATRDGYGDALVELGETKKNLVVLDADLSGSTKTNGFKKKYPERFINVGVAEQNLVGHAAGLALSGLVPFASSFAMFLSGRAWEIVRNSVAYPNLNVKLVSSHGGITVGEDGASHQCIEDFALMRVIPGMTVICPSDYEETKQIIHSIYEWEGPVYVRVGRPAIPILARSDYQFKIGKAEIRREGRDVTIISCGIMTHEAEKAVKILEEKGISSSFLNMATIKPLDSDAILREARKTGLIVTCEEHNVIGGLGSAVSELISEEFPIPVLKVGMKDQFGKSGTWQELMDYFEMRAIDIVKAVEKGLSLKKRI
jgi:transketolase